MLPKILNSIKAITNPCPQVLHQHIYLSNPSRDSVSTAALGSLCQDLMTLSVNISLLWHNLRLFPLITCYLGEEIDPTLLQPHRMPTFNTIKVPSMHPLCSLFSGLKHHSSAAFPHPWEWGGQSVAETVTPVFPLPWLVSLGNNLGGGRDISRISFLRAHPLL